MSSLPRTQKAIQITEHGDSSVLKLRQVPVPKAVGPNQLLVQNQVSGVNFIDTYHRTGLYPVALPLILGREGAGRVVGVGEGVEGFVPGDRVAYAGAGSYAQYSVVPVTTTMKLPDNLGEDIAAASFLQGLTALSLVRLAYTVRPNDWVLVQAAAGGTGLLLCQLCKLAGATVIGTVSTEEKAALARKAGADHIIFYTKESVPESVHQLTNGQGVHVVYDGVGKSTFQGSIASLRRLGSMISFGNASGRVEPVDIGLLQKDNLRLMRPSLFKYMTTRQEFLELAEPLMELLENKKLDIHISKVYPLAEASKAHDALEGRKTTGKVLLSVS
ncbi:MAG: hypothetical protein DHS80DRAFT_22618 [Piptocephalis tieghemiana]|nr:MAG: hypothetical protein DHS80DRAFT_22618 [Piptocephalis tieghemiana]